MYVQAVFNHVELLLQVRSHHDDHNLHVVHDLDFDDVRDLAYQLDLDDDVGLDDVLWHSSFPFLFYLSTFDFDYLLKDVIFLLWLELVIKIEVSI